MWVTAAVAAASAIAGLVGGARKRKKQKRLLRKRQNEIENTFNREYYQDFLEREQSQSFLARMREGMKNATKVADNSAVVTGATNEAKVAQKSALQKNYAGAVNMLAGQASRHKDNIRNWYENAKSGIYGQKQQMLDHSAQQWANFTHNAGQALGSIGGGIGEGASGAGAVRGSSLNMSEGLFDGYQGGLKM